ncbi:unnamed protein product [Camellia sinensis]
MKRMTKAFQLSAKQVRVADKEREREREREGGRRRMQRRRHPAIGDCRRPTGVEQQWKKRRATKNHIMNNMSILMPFMYSAPTSYRVLLNNASGYEFGLLDSHASNNPTCSQAPH